MSQPAPAWLVGVSITDAAAALNRHIPEAEHSNTLKAPDATYLPNRPCTFEALASPDPPTAPTGQPLRGVVAQVNDPSETPSRDLGPSPRDGRRARRLACASESEPLPVPPTVWVQSKRSPRMQRAAERHAEHVQHDWWALEACEYCRTEFYMLVPPLGAD